MASRKWRGLGRALQAFGQGLGQTSQVLFAMSQAKEASGYKRADFMATTLPQMLSRGVGREGILEAARQAMGREYTNYEVAINRAIKNYPLVNAQNLILGATKPAQIDAVVALAKDPTYLKGFGIEDPVGSVVADPDEIVEPGSTPRMKFTLPDGQVVDVGSERAMEAAKVRGRLTEMAKSGREAHAGAARDEQIRTARIRVAKKISDYFTPISGMRGGGGTGDAYDVGEAPGAVGAAGLVGGGGRASVSPGAEQDVEEVKRYNLTIAVDIISDVTTSMPLSEGWTRDDWAEVWAGVRPGVLEEIDHVMTAGRHLYTDARGNQLGHPQGSPEEIDMWRETQRYANLHNEYVQRIDEDLSTPQTEASWMPSYITGRTMDAQAMLAGIPDETGRAAPHPRFHQPQEPASMAGGYPPLVGPGGAGSPGEQLLDLPEIDQSRRMAVESSLPYGWKNLREMERSKGRRLRPDIAERTSVLGGEQAVTGRTMDAQGMMDLDRYERDLTPYQRHQLEIQRGEAVSHYPQTGAGGLIGDVISQARRAGAQASAEEEKQEQLETHRARQGEIGPAPRTDLPGPRDRAVNPYGQEIPMPPSAVSITEDITLSPEEESQFRTWYASWAAMPHTNMDNDPDAGSYAYRLAWKSGAEPSPIDGHWTSKFKFDDHPNRYVETSDGTMDSRSGEMVAREPSPGEDPNLQLQGIGTPFGQTITPVQRQFLTDWLSPESEPFDPLDADVEFDVGPPVGGPPDLPIAGAQSLPAQRGIYGPEQVETPPPQAEFNVGLPAGGAPSSQPPWVQPPAESVPGVGWAQPQAPLPGPQRQAMQRAPGVTSAELAGAAPPPQAQFDVGMPAGGVGPGGVPAGVEEQIPYYQPPWVQPPVESVPGVGWAQAQAPPAAPTRLGRYQPGTAPMHEEPLDTGGEPASGGERRYPGRFAELPKFEEFLEIVSQVSTQEGIRPKINDDQRDFYNTLKGHIEQYAAQFGVNPMLVAMVIYEETSFNGDPRSWLHANPDLHDVKGVMQVRDGTAQDMIQQGLTRFIDGTAFFSDEGAGNWPDWAQKNYRPQDRPADGIHAGVAYLRFLVDKYEGPEYPGLKKDQQSLWRIVLQAWNVGPGKMDESIKVKHGSWQNAIAAWNANPGQGWPYVTAFARAISLGAGLGSDAFE
jgi:hypothetical protein